LNAKFSRGGYPLFCTRNRNLIAKDALVGAAGMGNEDGDDEGPRTQCGQRDTGCSMLDTRCWVLDIGRWLLKL